MPLFQDASEEINGILVTAYGPHIVSGTVVQKASSGFGDDAQTYVVVWLGEGPWNRLVTA